jgi:GAF domain-containing protein
MPQTADPRTAQLEVLNEVARIATLDLELRPMLQRITDTLSRKFDWEFVALMTIDRDHNAFVLRCGNDARGNVSVRRLRPHARQRRRRASRRDERSDRHRRRAHVPNYVDTMPGAKSEICVPVQHHGTLVAVLNIESTRMAAFHGQLPLLTTVADQIAGAIASAQLYEEVKRRARLMEMMSEVSRTALEATDLRELLERIVRYIHERFPLEFAAIVLYDSEREEFVHTANAGLMVPIASRWPVSRGVVGRCIRTGMTQIVADVSRDPEYITINDRVTSEAVIPIRFQDKILGVLNLESASPDVFVPASVLAFEAFADQVAGAIHLASVNQRLAETSMQLEQKSSALEQANEHLAAAIETLHRISTQDGLTGVSNRRHFDETLALEWRRAARSRSPLSLLMLDIDFFKAFNDEAGHQAGDDCLRRVAQALRENLHRAADLVSRYGGEEFAILLRRPTASMRE